MGPFSTTVSRIGLPENNHLMPALGSGDVFSAVFSAGHSDCAHTCVKGFLRAEFPFPGLPWPTPSPQVDRDHDSALTSALEAPASRKRSREEDHGKVEARQAVRTRHIAWLRRASAGATSAWRPKLGFRRGANRWLLAVENQIRLRTDLSGFRYFVAPMTNTSTAAGFGDPLQWPVLSIAADRGSDGVSALHYLQRECKVCVEELFDPSHDSWRDFQRALRETGLTSY